MPSYRPVNMPGQYEKFPMPVPPAHASAEAEEERSFAGWAKRSVPTIPDAPQWWARLRCAQTRYQFLLMVRRRAAPSSNACSPTRAIHRFETRGDALLSDARSVHV